MYPDRTTNDDYKSEVNVILRPKICLFLILITLGLGLIACSDVKNQSLVPTDAHDPPGLMVVTTVSPITSLVENIGGVRINLEGIVPEGANSHTFEPAPSVASVLASADLIIANGLFLEESIIDLANSNKKNSAVILLLGDESITQEEWVFDFSFPETNGQPNPHLWTSPLMAIKYGQLIHDHLVKLDQENSSYYDRNWERLKNRLEELDRGIRSSIETIPSENRLLLTYHDSFPMFGLQYGVKILGAVQPSNFTEPSAREVARLIKQIQDNRVPAIFGSEVFPSPVMAQIAKEGGAEFVDELRDDDLPGKPGDPMHSYLGLILSDMKIMIPALGGNTTALDGFDTSLVFKEPSKAIYPQ